MDCSIKHIVHCWEVKDAFEWLPLAAFIGSTSGSDNTRKENQKLSEIGKITILPKTHTVASSVL